MSKTEGTIVGDKGPKPGFSYMLPNKTWLTIPPGANVNQVRDVQQKFWKAWNDYYARNRHLVYKRAKK